MNKDLDRTMRGNYGEVYNISSSIDIAENIDLGVRYEWSEDAIKNATEIKRDTETSRFVVE